MSELILHTEELGLDCPTVFGLAAPVKFYKFAWHIQQLRFFHLLKEEDVKNELTGGFHSNFRLRPLDEEAEFILLKNKGSEGYYYKKYKDLDFLFFSIAGHSEQENAVLEEIKKTESLSYCLTLDKPAHPEDLNFIQFL